MHITFVTGEFPPMQGGVGDYTRELAREFARRGLAVNLITRPAVAPQPLTALDHQYSVRHTQFSAWRSLLEIERFTRDSDVVHIQYQAAAYGMTAPIHFAPRWLRWRKPGRKVLVTFHDLKVPYLFPKAGALRWRAVLFLARNCHAVVVTNQEDRLSLAALQRPVALIPIGSNIAAAAPTPLDRETTRASLAVSPDEILLCYFGFLNASKGGETLIRILSKVASAGYNVRLLMLGGEVGASDPTNAAYAQKVKALLAELGLAHRVIWAGYRPAYEVTALWRASDITVLPYVDGVSLRRGTLMAALAHGAPIVSTTPRVPVEQFRDGENILLAAPGDVDALAAHVVTLVESPALRQRLSRGAAELAQAFTWARIADQHLELYRRLALPT